MACNCGKNTKSLQLENILKMATTECNIDKEKYVVYELNGKITYDKKSCWEKAGRQGNVKHIIYPL